MGGFILAVDGDWPAVVHNMANLWSVWRRMTRVLNREGGEAAGVQIFLQICCSVGADLRCGDVGG